MTFQKRLEACMKEGNLSVADLARWFDRSYQTVRGWALEGHEPGGAWLDTTAAETLLKTLETAVKKRKGFPVPRLSPTERIAHLKQVRDNAVRL